MKALVVPPKGSHGEGTKSAALQRLFDEERVPLRSASPALDESRLWRDVRDELGHYVLPPRGDADSGVAWSSSASSSACGSGESPFAAEGPSRSQDARCYHPKGKGGLDAHATQAEAVRQDLQGESEDHRLISAREDGLHALCVQLVAPPLRIEKVLEVVPLRLAEGPLVEGLCQNTTRERFSPRGKGLVGRPTSIGRQGIEASLN